MELLSLDGGDRARNRLDPRRAGSHPGRQHRLPVWPEPGSGLALGASQIGTAAAIYVAGAVLGACSSASSPIASGRKKLFLITLAVYITATIAGFSFFRPVLLPLPVLHRRRNRR